MIRKILAALATTAVVVAGLSAPALATGGRLTPPMISAPGKTSAGMPVGKAGHGVPQAGGVSASLTACAGGVYCHFYNTGAQLAVTGGAQVGTNIKDPFISTATDGSATFSLAELAAIKGSGASRQIVETGYAKNPGVFGDSLVHFWVGAWVNGTFQGWNSKFTDYAANTDLNAGQALTTGKSAVLRIQYDPTSPVGGAWWVYGDKDTSDAIAANWIGYFANTTAGLWGSGSTFTTTDQVQAFGEGTSQNTTMCGDLGNGAQGSAGTGTAAYFGSMTYISGPTVNIGSIIDPSSAGTGSPPPSSMLLTGTAGNIRTWSWGGPMWNATGSGTGTAGACR